MQDQADRKANERIIDQTLDEFIDTLLLQIDAYCAGVGAQLEANPAADLANFLLKKPELWVMHKQIMWLDCDEDWKRFTILCARAYEGKLQSPDGQQWDVEHMRAIWLNAAIALRVIQPTAVQQPVQQQQGEVAA